ncbi:hypothetical protein ONE63_006554 [Megalurothrips usitatus]|uniref:Transposase n=1 Tax=Megalurothrips usitatus TaxID=439358 RepID=A0AAV7XXW9_9NEOP|nr:hypothetical protein ONE63_006554 [Megalurothrips usitatus]
MAEIDRINHRVRPHPAYVPTEDWLNSACSVYNLMRKLNFRVDPSETPSVAHEEVPEPCWKLRTRVKSGELPLCAVAVSTPHARPTAPPAVAAAAAAAGPAPLAEPGRAAASNIDTRQPSAESIRKFGVLITKESNRGHAKECEQRRVLGVVPHE